jgi:hypothetical protein
MSEPTHPWVYPWTLQDGPSGVSTDPTRARHAFLDELTASPGAAGHLDESVLTGTGEYFQYRTMVRASHDRVTGVITWEDLP